MTALRMVLLLTVAGALASPALGQGSLTKITVKTSASKPDAKGFEEITLDIDIDKGWHIYANAPRHDQVESNKTVVSIVAPKVEEVTIKYPDGQIRKDTDGEKEIEYRVYEGTVRVTVRLKRIEANPLEVHLLVYACNKSVCLPKGLMKLKIP
jgi:hypothetical protein